MAWDFLNPYATPRVVQSFAASGAISATGGTIVTFSGAASQTLTLPAASAGLQLEVHNTDATDTVLVARAGADTIDGAATSLTLLAGQSRKFRCVAAGVWVSNITSSSGVACNYFLSANSANAGSAVIALNTLSTLGLVGFTQSAGVLTCLQAGVYQVTFGGSVTAGSANVSLRKNGTPVASMTYPLIASAIQKSFQLNMATGDTLDTFNGSGALTFIGGNDLAACHLMVNRV